MAITMTRRLNKPFWVVWAVELWERFGYYGVQAILALYFVQQLGYTEAQSFYVFGSFSAFVYGFTWIGGWLGDKYFGAKRMLVLGAVVLALSYSALALATHDTIFYALSGIIIGNSLFKANPASLISKMYEHDYATLDGAMTYYYMAVNVGSMLSMSITTVGSIWPRLARLHVKARFECCETWEATASPMSPRQPRSARSGSCGQEHS